VVGAARDLMLGLERDECAASVLALEHLLRGLVRA